MHFETEIRTGRWLKAALLASALSLGLIACGEEQQSSKDETAAPDTVADTGSTAPATPSGMEAMPGTDDMAGMEGMDHSEHAMTPAQFAELRQKILLYRDMPDDQIAASMSRMPPDFHMVLSAEGAQGDIGLLALGHGYTLGGNEQFEKYVEPFAGVFPTAIAPGMAMMSSSHIQAALDELTQKHGVKKIVVVPFEPGDESTLNHQWQYIFGLRDDAPYLSVPRVKTDAEIVMTKSPEKDPRMALIMMDYALEISEHPAEDLLIILSHGPEDPNENPAELAQLEAHAKIIKEESDFEDVKLMSIQDDAPREVRAANLEEMRSWIKEANDKGQDVIIVPMLLTKGGFHARVAKELEPLKFKMAQHGLIEHPLFEEWLGETIRLAIQS